MYCQRSSHSRTYVEFFKHLPLNTSVPSRQPNTTLLALTLLRLSSSFGIVPLSFSPLKPRPTQRHYLARVLRRLIRLIDTRPPAHDLFTWIKYDDLNFTNLAREGYVQSKSIGWKIKS
jgi:hypothetical protein